MVVGCGNPDAGDDAIGILAIREARTALEAIPGVRVVEGAIGPDLTDLLAGGDAAVIVDAIRTPGRGRPPGEIVRAEAGPEGLPSNVGGSLSSHGFGVAEAVALAMALGRTAPVVLLGVEAGGVTMGRPPGPEVEGAVPEVVRRVLAEASRLASTA